MMKYCFILKMSVKIVCKIYGRQIIFWRKSFYNSKNSNIVKMNWRKVTTMRNLCLKKIFAMLVKTIIHEKKELFKNREKFYARRNFIRLTFILGKTTETSGFLMSLIICFFMNFKLLFKMNVKKIYFSYFKNSFCNTYFPIIFRIVNFY